MKITFYDYISEVNATWQVEGEAMQALIIELGIFSSYGTFAKYIMEGKLPESDTKTEQEKILGLVDEVFFYVGRWVAHNMKMEVVRGFCYNTYTDTPIYNIHALVLDLRKHLCELLDTKKDASLHNVIYNLVYILQIYGLSEQEVFRYSLYGDAAYQGVNK